MIASNKAIAEARLRNVKEIILTEHFGPLQLLISTD